MLKTLRLKQFKSFADESVDFAPVTILIGANGAGKSNLIDAIRFLHGISLGMSIAEILGGRWEAGRQTWPGLRGAGSDVIRKGGGGEFAIGSQWQINSEVIDHRIRCNQAPHVLLSGEYLESSRDGGVVLDADSPNRERRRGTLPQETLHPSYRFEGGEETQMGEYGAAYSLIWQVHATHMLSLNQVNVVCDALIGAMREAYFFDITPSHMRNYVPAHLTNLGLRAENASAIAWDLCSGGGGTKQELIDWLEEFCAPEFTGLDFTRTELGDIMLVAIEPDGTRVPARSLSDGTLRFLGQLLALRSTPPGSVLLLEDIENGLHPTRVRLLVEAMRAAALDRGLQIITTTHSPLVLDALSKNEFGRAILVARSPDYEGTIARNIRKIEDAEAVRARRGADWMIASGWFERAV